MKSVTGAVSVCRRRPQHRRLRDGRHGHDKPCGIGGDHLRSARVTTASTSKVYFSMAHDPTELNYQGPDRGTQYASTIFVANDTQRKIAEKRYIASSTRPGCSAKIVTTLESSKTFYRAGLPPFPDAEPDLSHRPQRPAEDREPQRRCSHNCGETGARVMAPGQGLIHRATIPERQRCPQRRYSFVDSREALPAPSATPDETGRSRR